MRAKEFVRSHNVDEALPAVAGAIGGALLRGAAAAGTALARGAVSGGKAIGNVATQAAKGLGGAIQSVGTSAAGALGSTVGKNLGNKLVPPPSQLPPNTKIEPMPSKPGDKPNSLRFKIGDAEFVLDDPKTVQQLGQMAGQQK